MLALATVLSLLGGGAALAGLSWKWKLPAREATGLIGLSTLAAAAGTILVARAWPPSQVPIPVLAGALVGQISLFAGGTLWRFHRDPERQPPDDPRAMVSPADGTVIYVRRLPPGAVLQVEKNGAVMGLGELEGTSLAGQELWQVGISMVFTDVHVNRAPIQGQATRVRHRPGPFLSLRRSEAASANERQTMVFEDAASQAAVVQVASRLVRRIESYIREGDAVERGQRIGIIKLGSQVDLFFPLARTGALAIAPGQRVTAGQTVICRLGE